ncbi:MAG TPA: hypothetical protein VHK91_16875 [Flavisolibacter sp.]|jgi:hypothetical protein|nr:hypothetical protein [Flavisolibacter sp.]
MKTKESKAENLVKIQEKTLLMQVSEKLKGKPLFPEKMEAARTLLKDLKILKA